jgi:hypothetical protein
VSPEADNVKEGIEITVDDQARVLGDKVRLREVLQRHGAVQDEERCVTVKKGAQSGPRESLGRFVQLVVKAFGASHTEEPASTRSGA